MDRINLSSCPALAAGNVPPWYGPSGSPGRVTNLTGMDRATGFSAAAGDTITPRFPVTAGLSYASSVQVKPAYTGTLGVGLDWYSSSGYLSSTFTTVNVVNGVVQRAGVIGVAPAGAVEALQVISATGAVSITAHLPEQSTAIGTYFDGASAATNLLSAGTWTGTAGASTSRVTLLPQLVDSVAAEATANPATLQTVQFTPRELEVILVAAFTGAPDATIGAPTAPGLTLNEIASGSTSAYAPFRLFRAVVPANPGTIRVTLTTAGASGTRAPTMIVERWAYAQLAATPATNATRLGTATAGSPVGTPSATLTPAAANSAMSWFAGDYNGVTGTTVTYRAGTEKYRRRVSSVINVWSAWQRTGAAGTATTIGMTAPTGQKWSMIGVEVQPGPAPVEAALPQTAAERYGWGTALPSSDEFATGTVPDPTRWGVYDGPGHAGNGVRSPAQVTVQDGYLRIAGTAGGASGGISQKYDQRFGRWEVRMRTAAVTPGSAGAPYHPVLIVWPASELWPDDGEYDWMENDEGQTTLNGFLHLPHPPGPVEQIGVTGPAIDLTAWHNYGFEWTNGRLKGYVDGNLWFDLDGAQTSSNGRRLDSMPGGHLTIQLDNNTGAAGLRPAYMDVEWARTYTVAESVAVKNIAPDGARATTGHGAPALSAPVAQPIAPAGHAPTAGHGAAVIGRSVVTITPAGHAPTTGHGAPAAAAGARDVAPASSSATTGHGTPTITAGARDVAPTPNAAAAGHGAPAIAAGTVTVAPTGHAPATGHGAPTVAAGTRDVAPTGHAPAAGHGAPTVAAGAVTVAPTPGASTTLHGVLAIGAGPRDVTPVGVSSPTLHGAPTVTVGARDITPTGSTPTTGHGAPAMGVGPRDVAPTGHTPTTGHGAATVNAGAVTVAPTSSVATTGHGAVTVGRGAVAVAPAGSTAGTGHGAPALGAGPVDLAPAPHTAGTAHGAPAVAAGPVTLEPADSTATARHGAPALGVGPRDVTPTPGAASTGHGAVLLAAGPIVITPASHTASTGHGDPAAGKGARDVAPTGHAATTGHGEGTLTRTVAPTGSRASTAHGAAQLEPGPVTVAPVGARAATGHGAPAVGTGLTEVNLDGHAAATGHGAPALGAGPVDLAPAPHTAGTAHGAPAVDIGDRDIAAGGRSARAEHGVPDIAPGTLTIIPAPTAATTGHGVITLRRGAVVIVVAPLHATTGHGDPTLTPGPYTVTPGGHHPTGRHGAPTIGAGPVGVTPGEGSAATRHGAVLVTAGAVPITPDGQRAAVIHEQPVIVRGAFVAIIPGRHRVTDHPARLEASDAPASAGRLEVTDGW